MTQRSVRALSLYKELIRYASYIDNPQNKTNALQQIRSTFREHSKETNPEVLTSLLKQGESKLGFLKMTTPRVAVRSSQGTTRLTIKDGEVIEGSAEKLKKRGFNDQRIDMEDYQKHMKLLRRQHFMDRN